VEGAKGVYGTHNLTQTFEIGRSLIAVASTTTHKTQIYLNGKLAYQWRSAPAGPACRRRTGRT